MSAQFQVDTERIRGASGDITRISADIESLVSSMMSRLNSLQDAWKGSASAQFQTVCQDWQQTQAQVKGSLDSIGRVLSAAGVQYAETEAAATRMFS